MRPVCVMIVVRPKLGLKMRRRREDRNCSRLWRRYRWSQLPVYRCAPGAVTKMSSVRREFGSLQAQRVARVGVGGKAIQAETMVKPPCNL